MFRKCIKNNSPKQGPNFQNFWRCENGSAALEYAIIASMISVVILVGLMAVSGSIQNLYATIASAVGGP